MHMVYKSPLKCQVSGSLGEIHQGSAILSTKLEETYIIEALGESQPWDLDVSENCIHWNEIVKVFWL